MQKLLIRIQEKNVLGVLAALCMGLAVPLGQVGISYTIILAGTAVGLVLIHSNRRLWLDDAIANSTTLFGFSVLTLFVCWMPNIFVSPNPIKSIEVWVRTAGYLALGTMLWSFLRHDEKLLRICQKAIVLGAAFSAFLVAVNFFGGTEYIRAIRLKGFVEGYPPMVMKGYAAPAACLVPVLICVGWRLGRKWFAFCLGIAMIMALLTYLVSSGASAAGFFIALYLLAFVRLGGLQSALPVVGLFGLAIFIAVGFVWLSTQEITHYEIPNHDGNWNANGYPLSPEIIDRHRQEIWRFVLSHIPDVFWFGYGIDTINNLPGATKLNPNLEAEFLPSHPHSWALEIMAETGIFGILAFLGVLGALFHSASKRALAGSPEAYAMIALFGIYFGSGLFSVSFWASWWQLILILLWTCLAAMDNLSQRRSS